MHASLHMRGSLFHTCKSRVSNVAEGGEGGITENGKLALYHESEGTPQKSYFISSRHS